MVQKKLNSYLELCSEFYDLIRPSPPEDAYAFYRDYVAKSHGMVLEPMCGSGRFLLPLLQEGFNIQGFDASEHMISALLAKAKIQHLLPDVWNGFTEDLNTENRYNLIFIPSGSFGHLTSLVSVKKSLKTFYDHLTSDGILLFEAETSKTIPEQLGIWRGLVYHKDDDSFILVNRLTTYENNICYSIDRYELIEQGQVVKTEIERFDVRIYDDSQVLVELLKEVGFKEIKLIKAFDRTQTPNADDASIVYECKK